MDEKRKGILLVLSGPSGVGKGTVGKKLRASDENISFSVSVTTRGLREGEIPGVDYLYITEEEFAALEKEGRLLLEIDPQGAQTVIGKRPDCVSVFVLPPSWASLRSRLEGRGTESREQVETRLKNAREEVKTVPMYDYAIVNADGPEGIEKAFLSLKAIMESEKCRTSRYSGLIPEE